MAHPMIHACPVCAQPLRVVKMKCPSCLTAIEGDFTAERFLALSDEQRDFAISFILNSGSIREMERELGVSYPTVRARLDEVIAALGGGFRKAPSRRELLEKLARGEISGDQAMETLGGKK